eukprot:TRINITY_DN21040_c0_g1_i2.p1 TRINITY_DN21040_c0_g1~~TRINITY_DN21040_c0_g1_i2.p1  ORF type:complete len:613 (+),score=114.47 TRINITY_DN21040_c0_g1_i2:15-1853(+)
MASPAASSTKRKADDDPEVDGDHTNRHLRFLSQRLQNMFNVKEMSDTVFLVEGKEIFASRLVVAAGSDYFRALLAGENFKEKSSGGPIEIHEVEAQIFELCLKYLYSGAAELSRDNVVKVLKAADMFRIEALCAACLQEMRNSIDKSTCFQYLAAAEQLPNLSAKLRQSCLEYLEASLEEIFRDPLDDQADVNSLSLATMLDVCSHVGLGISRVNWKAECLKHVVDAVTAWGGLHFGSSAKTVHGLYNLLRHQGLMYFKQHAAISADVRHTFLISQRHLQKNEVMKSDFVKSRGYPFNLHVNTKDKNRESIGVYVRMFTSRLSYPPWWPCHACVGFTSNLPGKDRPETLRLLFDTVTSSIFGDARGLGAYAPHGVFPVVQNPANDDVCTSVTLTAEIVFDSISSLCMAFMFFYPHQWTSAIHANDLKHMLASDDLPVTSEDELLVLIISLGKSQSNLEKLLKHLRWQYLSPASLLDACRKPNAGVFRICETTKQALHWLLGQGSKPQSICERRRHSYCDSVQDSRPIQQEVLVEWLLRDPSSETQQQVEAADAKVSEAECRAQAAEVRAAEAERRAQAAEARAAEAERSAQSSGTAAAVAEQEVQEAGVSTA